MDALWSHLRFALRTLRKSPGFSLVAVVTLAAGIGANTAIFSIADALISRPLHGVAAGRLAAVAIGHKAPAAAADFLDWQRLNHSFEQLCAYRNRDGSLAGRGDFAQRIFVAAVTPNFFATLHVAAGLGRAITITDRDEAAIAVLSYGLWQQRFGGDPQIIGRVIDVDSEPHTIVGVMDKDFEVPVPTDVWVPLRMTAAERADRRALTLRVIGRLKRSVEPSAAQAEMLAIGRQLELAYPDTNLHRPVHVMPLAEFVQGTITRAAMFLLLLLVGTVLVVACANIAGLQLARAGSRAREIAVRTALGATRSRIVQLVFVENTVIAAAGGLLGVAVARALVGALLRSMPGDIARLIPGFTHIHVDRRALLFAIAVSSGSALLASAAPALRSARADPAEVLNEARGVGASGQRRRLQDVFVILQVAVAFTLLVISGMSVSSLRGLLQSHSVSEPERVLVMSVALPSGRYSNEAGRHRFAEAAIARLAALPGVTDAATFSTIPLSNNGTRFATIDVEGHPAPAPALRAGVVVQHVSPAYFRLMRIPLWRGRPLLPTDDAAHQAVAVISRNMAGRFWPAENPLGKRISVGPADAPSWRIVVGIAEDVLYDWTDRVPEATVYLPAAQAPPAAGVFAIRVTGEPSAFVQRARAEFAAIDPDVPVFDVMSLGDAIRESLAGSSQLVAIMSLLALFTAAVAAVGLYGVISGIVSARIGELGLRMALGAQPADILRLVLSRGASLAAAGLTAGIALAVPATRLARAVVFGAGAAPAVIAGEIMLLLVAVMLAACYVPARRAMNADPLVTLRAE